MSIEQANILKSIQVRWKRWQVNRSVWRLARLVTQHAPLKSSTASAEDSSPVVFFNASTRLVGLSQNAAFALLAAAGLQFAGVPVVYFTCQAGMRRCVLGTQPEDLQASPPCRACIAQSHRLFAHAPAVPFQYLEDSVLASALEGLDISQLASFVFQDQPLGMLVLPSVRWVLRRHHLQNDSSTRQLFRDYILSAQRVGQEFSAFLDQAKPRSVVVFNGMFFPEAVARRTAQQRGLRVITHEVGLQPFSGFFTDGQATAYPLEIPDSFQLDETMNARLDSYLEQRFQGKFSMAGIQFWKAIDGLSDKLLEKAAHFRQLVAVFTNVIFDTSQPHSNVVFPHMFAWLDLVVALAQKHRDTLFVMRAHPDENRLWKESRESVANWVEDNQVKAEPNIVFIDSSQPLSSYELVQRSKFIMVYNSTIGLEASILGSPVLCAGKARFTQLPTVFSPKTIHEYQDMAERFLLAEKLDVPLEFQHNARRFLYFQLFRSSLPFENFLEADGIWPGFVRLRSFTWQQLTPEYSLAHRVLVDGILNGGEFILPEAVE